LPTSPGRGGDANTAMTVMGAVPWPGV